MTQTFGFDIPTLITTRSFYAPRLFDAPKTYLRKFSYIGEEPDELLKLARELNSQKATGPLFMIGAAHALDAQLKLGQCFLINTLMEGSQSHSLYCPKELRFLPQSNLLLYSGQNLHTKQKAALYAETQARLIDSQILAFWKVLKPENRERLILIRSVIETASEKFNSEAKDRLNWQSFVEKSSLLQAPVRHLAHQRYQSEITDLFERMLRTNALIESIDPHSVLFPKRMKTRF